MIGMDELTLGLYKRRIVENLMTGRLCFRQYIDIPLAVISMLNADTLEDLEEYVQGIAGRTVEQWLSL